MGCNIDKTRYFYNNNRFYLCPNDTIMFHLPNKIIFTNAVYEEIIDIKNFIIDSKEIKIKKNFHIGLPVTRIGANLIEEYDNIIGFFKINQEFTFDEFLNEASTKLCLCNFFKPTQIQEVYNILDKILKEKHYIINVFNRPYIHLKELEVIMDVNAVQRINNKTINHLAKHSENWKNYNTIKSEVEPDKLLTKISADNYSIYENVIFYHLMKDIFNFLKRNIYNLENILNYYNQSFNIDSLDRLNHSMYFLAIGRLYQGFYKIDSTDELKELYNKLESVYKNLSIYKKSQVYIKNMNTKPVKGEIKRTNLFIMQKDYRHIYNLYKYFQNRHIELPKELLYKKQLLVQRNYEKYSIMLIIFAASHFNFQCLTKKSIYKNNLFDIKFQYENWKLKIINKFDEFLNIDTIIIEFQNKGEKINYLIIPNSFYFEKYRKEQYENILKINYQNYKKFNKIIFFEPFEDTVDVYSNYHFTYINEDTTLLYAVIPISISDINSFRRIQKIIYEGMIFFNNENICAFCGEKYDHISKNKVICNKCKTEVINTTCCFCKKEFRDAHLMKKYLKKESLNFIRSDILKQEKKYLFRNVMNLTDFEVLCPYCNSKNKIN